LSSPRTHHLRIPVAASESSTPVYGEVFFNSLLGVSFGFRGPILGSNRRFLAHVCHG
jgi:hypothetical protein